MQNLFSSITSLFFPLHCIGCGRAGSAVCLSCSNSIPLAQPTHDRYIFAIYEYGNRIVEKAIRDIKYHRKKEPALALLYAGAPYITSFISDLLMSEDTVPCSIVPIPQHKKKLHDRGYNQTVLLATTLASFFDTAHVVPLLEKYRYTLPQARIKNKNERLRNVSNSMRVSKQVDPHHFYIIVDDVTTTGATINEALRALTASGAVYICAITLAHGYARKNKTR
jgi:competence protein ComFC